MKQLLPILKWEGMYFVLHLRWFVPSALVLWGGLMALSAIVQDNPVAIVGCFLLSLLGVYVGVVFPFISLRHMNFPLLRLTGRSFFAVALVNRIYSALSVLLGVGIMQLSVVARLSFGIEEPFDVLSLASFSVSVDGMIFTLALFTPALVMLSNAVELSKNTIRWAGLGAKLWVLAAVIVFVMFVLTLGLRLYFITAVLLFGTPIVMFLLACWLFDNKAEAGDGEG
ncbi:MAG: hypothetical protein FWB80_08590 [Defluviitaleaceae bacterium]|nr:hypothetical protein [Defluviitaleaceae bacterium]